MQRFLYSIVLLLCIVSAGLNATELQELLDSEGWEENSLNTVELVTLTSMMEYAEKNGLMIFETLYEAGTYLKQQKIRVRINGDDLRRIEQRFDLGGDRVQALLPVEKIQFIEIGLALNQKPEMEVYLTEKHSDFLEIGDFYLSRHFGFQTLQDTWFDDPFGIKLKYLFFKLDLSGIELYEESKIAIYASGFPKPKRWRIKAIRLLE